MVIRKHVVRILGGLLLATALASPAPPAGAAQQQQLNIGYSVPGLGFPFFALMLDGAAAAAAEDGGLSILPLDGQDKDAVQLAGCENALARGISGLVISPRTVDGLSGCFSAAEAAGVPVVTVDRRAAPGTPVLAHVGADNVAGGVAAGRFIATRLQGTGRVIELQGTPGASPAIDRSAGFNQAMAENPNMSVIAQQTGNFTADDALKVTENILTSIGSTPDNPGFEGLFAANDDMVTGAVQAIQARGLDPGKFTIVGFDALKSALDLIQQGKLTGTVDQFPNEQAYKAIGVLKEYVRNGTRPDSDVVLLVPRVISIDNINDASTPH
jgi:ABC-type sugar transport system substrate-binding protein